MDPRPEAVEGGEIKIRITPQLVHDIFDEYPIVATAYSDNVPKKVQCSHIYQSASTILNRLVKAFGGAVLEAVFSVQAF